MLNRVEWLGFAAMLVVFSLQAEDELAGLLRADLSANLAAGAKVEASSAAGNPGEQYSTAGLTDNRLATMWATAKNAKPPQWVKVTFARPQAFDTLVLVTRDLPDLYANWKSIAVTFANGDPVAAELDRSEAPSSAVSEPEMR